MSISFYESTINPVKACLKVLPALLNKAVEQKGKEAAEALLVARLADDMLPLSFQIHLVCDCAVKFVNRVQGEEAPETGSYETITTIEEAKKRIAAANEALASADRAKFDARVDEVVEFGLGPGKSGKLPAKDFVSSYTLPNIHFHLMIAYAILRSNGVNIGKLDFLPPFGLDKIMAPAS